MFILKLIHNLTYIQQYSKMEVSSIQPLDDNDLLLNELSEREEKREKNFKLVQLIFVILKLI